MIALDTVIPVLFQRDLLPPSRRCVFVAGSIIRGWGNRTSDLDIYVVTQGEWHSPTSEPNPVQLIPDTVLVETFYVDGQRWDVEYWLDLQVDQMLGKMSWDEALMSRATSGELSWLENDLLERLGYAVALEGTTWLRDKANQLSSSAFTSVRISHALHEMDLAIEDAVGQLDNADFESAVLAARLAFGHAVDALLASHGEYGHNEKWRARRVLAVCPPQLSFQDYWTVETMRRFDPLRPRIWVEEVLEQCQQVAAGVSV